MTITNGTVEYERTVRPADFESKKAKVSLSFAVEDGSDPAPVVAKVMDMAVAEVHRRLGLAVDYPQVDVAKVAAEKTKRAKAPPAEVPAENPTVVAGTASTADVTNAPSDDDPAAIGDPEPDAEQEIVYTDKDLHMAVHTAIEHKAGNKKIVDLVVEFTNPPGTPAGERIPGKSMTTIEQDRRGEFLARLKAMCDA